MQLLRQRLDAHPARAVAVVCHSLVITDLTERKVKNCEAVVCELAAAGPDDLEWRQRLRVLTVIECPRMSSSTTADRPQPPDQQPLAPTGRHRALQQPLQAAGGGAVHFPPASSRLAAAVGAAWQSRRSWCSPALLDGACSGDDGNGQPVTGRVTAARVAASLAQRVSRTLVTSLSYCHCLSLRCFPLPNKRTRPSHRSGSRTSKGWLATLGLTSRRRDCHFADIPSSSLSKRQLKGEGGAAE